MSMSKFNHARVSGIFCVVPEKRINIDDEIRFYENDAAKLSRNKKILGLGTRHVVPDGVTAADLSEEAARKLIESMHVDVNDIDTLIVASINHDYIGNSDACILQAKLGLSEECACFDTSGLGCTDVVYALWLAHSLVESGASQKCLVLEGSTSSLITDIRNRNSNMLFGDAGAAILIERSNKEISSFFHLKTIGKDWKKIVSPAGGFRLPIRQDIIDTEILDPAGNLYYLWDSIMQGGDVFKFAIENAPESIEKILSYADKTHEEIDFFSIHQANGQIVRTIIKHAGLPTDKASSETFTKYGNCGGTSVLINYCDQMYNKENKNNVFVSFGVGLSVASCMLDLSDSVNGGISLYNCPTNIQTRDELISEWIKYIKNESDLTSK